MATVTQNMVLQSIFIGVIIAVLVIAYNKIVIGNFVRALIKAEAIHPSFAKSFAQLGIKKNVLLKFAMRRGGLLSKLVREIDEENLPGFYYIPEDKLYRAGRIYGGHDVDFLMVALIIVILLFSFGLILSFMPALMNQIMSMFG